MTYEGNADLRNKDLIERKAIEVQVNEFGQTPKQIFFTPHPKKFSKKIDEIYINPDEIKLDSISLNSEDNSNSKKRQSGLSNLSVNSNSDIINLSLDNENESYSNFIVNEKEILFDLNREYTSFFKYHKK